MPPSSFLNSVFALGVSDNRASPVECVVYVPLRGSVAARLYLQVPTEFVITNVMDLAVASQSPPSTWNSFAASFSFAFRHQGVPLPMLVSMAVAPPKLLVHFPSAAVPLNAVVWIVALIVLFLFSRR